MKSFGGEGEVKHATGKEVAIPPPWSSPRGEKTHQQPVQPGRILKPRRSKVAEEEEKRECSDYFRHHTSRIQGVFFIFGKLVRHREKKRGEEPRIPRVSMECR